MAPGQQKELPTNIKLMIFRDILKDIKKKLPSKCTYLSSVTDRNGEIKIKVVIGKQEYRFGTPADLNFTNHHIKEIHTSILEKCQ